ncbi:MULTISPECIES: ABC transporter substrate-binding protein [Paenibacillus]|uniref:Extracellular solute-binding protein family 1 n=2 Tax=Paenibacillus lactis TaxID=228574 RepID=G4HKR4_9BACL|nr:ABC transporter substrate-binding protein [Paenibacillus lactis]EHB59604.1 extracellular solute-binding protein family 1 [Paenibacillus lactis 154]MBP1896166.1 putative aldouronate transport system substrate-binding protein [Paenibacillus lactis]MCM3496634.1 ABC transporter substrate-binding protein [Paenibacillus lactis]GIO94305.1 ABC transporter substrate-binding protein [Paenibacillus lactis]HAF99991.1 ABC transporter substrate-binding protein [Paenibacillus lactis]
MKQKKRISLLLAVMMMATFVLAACGGDSGNSANGGQKENGGTDAQQEEKLEPMTMTYYSADSNANWVNMQDAVGKKLTEKTGVTIQAEYAVDGSNQKLPLMVASGEYPDLVFAKGDANLFVDAGAFIDLTDLIEEHAPNIKKVYGDYMSRLKWSNEDEAIYVLPTLAAVDHEALDAGGTFQIQHEVLKELGYPELKTVKDYENALKEYYEKHPTIDGQPTIPLTLNADGWRIMISVTNPAFIATGVSDDGEYYIDPETTEAKLHYKRPEEKEYFRWLNHMNASGLLDKETFVQKTDQYEAKISSGRVLGVIDQEWGFGNATNALRSAGKENRTYARFPIQLDESTKDATFQDTGYVAGWGVGITSSAKDPVRIIKFLDYLASEEGQILMNWGIEGEHYNVVDGKRVIPEEVQERKTYDNANFTKETGIGLYNAIFPRYGDGVKDSTGNYYTTNFPETIKENYTPSAKETLKAYGVEMWKDLWPKKEEFPVKPWGVAYNIPVPSDSNINITYKKVEEITRKRIPEIILADPAKFDQLYDQFIKELNDAGAEKMEKEYTELVRQRVELWNS